MMIKRKNLEQDQYQDVNWHFRTAYLVVSGALLVAHHATDIVQYD